MRVVGDNVEQPLVLPIREALKLADSMELDLIEISPKAEPPVCKIMDYGKYRFEQTKREKENRKNQKVIELKEIRLSATIDQHDMEVKAKACQKFLGNGDKVKVTIRFKGRQIKHGDIGMDVMDAFYEMVKDAASVDKPAKQEGRNMIMILVPKAN